MDLIIRTASAQSQPQTNIGTEYDLAFESLGSFVDILTPLLFSIASIMVMFYFIIGAFEMITSQGDKAHIVSARAKIYHSLIGFILLIVIFLIMQYLIPALGLKDFQIF